MAARFQTTVYNEKGRKIVVAIKDNVFSGMTYDFDTIGLQLQYDSESQQGQERFTPIIGSRCSLSLLINNNDLQTLLLDIGLAVEGRFTMELTAYEDDNTTVSFKWYGYIVTDLVEFEDVPLSIGYQAQISAIDGLGWLKTPYIRQRQQCTDILLDTIKSFNMKKFIISMFSDEVGAMSHKRILAFMGAICLYTTFVSINGTEKNCKIIWLRIK